MKKVFIVVGLLCALLIGSAQAVVVFQDTFENHALGSDPRPGAADIGTWNGGGGIFAIENTYSNGGSQGVKLVRELNGAYPFVLGMATPAGNGQAGYTMLASVDRLQTAGPGAQASWYQSGGIYFSFDDGGASFGATIIAQRFVGNSYMYLKSGAYVKSDVTVILDNWVRWETALHFIPGTTPGTVTGTYDAYVTDLGTGTKYTVCTGIAFNDNLPTNAPIRMWFYPDAPETATWGGDVTAYFDNMKIEKVPEPATMALLGLGALGLIRRNRR